MKTSENLWWHEMGLSNTKSVSLLQLSYLLENEKNKTITVYLTQKFVSRRWNKSNDRENDSYSEWGDT